MSDCKACKGKYKECIGQESYAVEDIRWCPHQVIWLIEEFFYLDGGGIHRTNLEWPDSLMSELPSIQRFAKTSAYFTKAVEVIAELAVRLKSLGMSGVLLLAELQAGMEGHLTSEADAAFHYITGNYRKVDSYPHWRANRKYNKKGKNTQIREKLDKPTRYGV